ALLRDADVPLDVQVDCWLLIAAAELAEHRADPARAAVERALRVAEAEHLRRPVLEAAAPVRRLLREDESVMDRHGWLSPAVADAPGAALTPPATAGDGAPLTLAAEPLTARETEVLTLLAALLSTEEIAGRMFVSVNTVKTHIRGILRKLAATRRNEAVRRARTLGLL
ncbi:MAG TPA: LuxR C-terminal-related transcriptional regulator, partial [Pilimelia sp.]|nr:LuxR C-terminal-related transcriptional regulator [Pilimelia sp.]